MDIWKNKSQILAGIKNTIIKQKHIEEIAEARMEICNACPHKSTKCAALIKTCCSLCGCSLNYKTHSLKSSCPDNLWPAIETE